MIYLDHAAATPVDDRVLKAMEPYFAEKFFNPSAAYLPAKEVSADYETAKGVIAHAIGAKASDLIMTAGATEANNLAFTSLGSGRAISSQLPPPCSANACARRGSPQLSHPSVLYLVTEHDSVRNAAKQHGGEAIAVLPNGLIDMDDLRSKLTDEVELVSVSLVNNELGVVQPLAEISALLRESRLNRMQRGVKRQLLLHSDASQALNLLNINVARLGVDMLTLNSAKIYGPKGVGALYVAHGVRLEPLTVGGGQEKGLRSGTENIPGVVGFAKATELACEHLNGNRKKYAKWRKILLEGLTNYELINRKHFIDNFIVLCYNGIDAERLIFLLEGRGIYVATGAACAASKGEKSHVLKAIGLSDTQIAGSLRLSLGETNDETQIQNAVQIINEVVEEEYKRVRNLAT